MRFQELIPGFRMDWPALADASDTELYEKFLSMIGASLQLYPQAIILKARMALPKAIPNISRPCWLFVWLFLWCSLRRGSNSVRGAGDHSVRVAGSCKY